MSPTSTLTDVERTILRLESRWWQYAGVKEQAVRDKFGVSMTTYYARINRLIDREDAMAFDPLLVKRLRRLRDDRKRNRFIAMEISDAAVDDYPPSR